MNTAIITRLHYPEGPEFERRRAPQGKADEIAEKMVALMKGLTSSLG